MKAPKLAICVTFHFVRARLTYLRRIASQFASLADEVDVTIVTNAADPESAQALVAAVEPASNVRCSTFTPAGLGHPYLLTWSHFAVMRTKLQDASFTHFMYTEDDLLFTAATMDYWLTAREVLRGHGLIPSILRVEQKPPDATWYSTDMPERVSIEKASRLVGAQPIGYVNLPNPYQGMYLLDRPLMSEHLSGPSSSPDFGPWFIREKAAQGLTFASVPHGFKSRNVVPFEIATKQIPETCFVHHLPNNYATDPASKFGKVPVKNLLY